MTQDNPPDEPTRTGAGTSGGDSGDGSGRDGATPAPAGPAGPSGDTDTEQDGPRSVSSAAPGDGSASDGSADGPATGSPGAAGDGVDAGPADDTAAAGPGGESAPAPAASDGGASTGSGTTAASRAGVTGVSGTAPASPGTPADEDAAPQPDHRPDTEAVSTQDPPTDRWAVPANPWARPGSTAADAPAAGSGGAAPDADTRDGPTDTTPVPADGTRELPAHPGATSAPAPGGPTPPPWAVGAPPASPRPPGRGRRGVVLVAAGLLIALVAGALGGLVGARIAGGSGGTAPAGSIEAVAAKVLPAVVQIRVDGGAGNVGDRGEGSGMIVGSDGLILTNNHVVAPAAQGGTLRVVLQDGRSAIGSIVGQDPQSDIALVRTDLPGLKTVELGDSDRVRVGQQVTAFGAPLGLGGSVTTGIVSAVDRAVGIPAESGAPGASDTVLNAIQTDAAINPGNSGGPLVDADGRVVGINSAIATAGPGGGSIGVGFSIPINQARRIADQLRSGGKATHAVLGVTVGNDPQLRGAVIQEVTPDGAAAKAGLRLQEIVARLGDQRVTTGTDLQAAVRSQPPGSVVQLEVLDAGGATRTVEVTLGEQ
ncbi:trypsin-like peptidase domain-containing protein [Pseudonocardia sp. HH130629-09]|uniref:trypsin-like peptidase domain-containing protein n=1 Tax=Pseudonocardia sp. HH130629-09 TaxID=1641402 RepID=UPI000761B07A|nr:trypsin-like peptidase domain-containing protein [Pseudonocardia sp. HH130629-09]